MKIASLFFFGKIASKRFVSRPSSFERTTRRRSASQEDFRRLTVTIAIYNALFFYLQIHLDIQAMPEARKNAITRAQGD